MKRERIIEKVAFCCLIVTFAFVCYFLYKRVDYMIDSDCSSEMVLARLLAEEGGILSKNWYYSTEIRVLNTQLVWAVLFRFIDDWHMVRVLGTAFCYGVMVLSYLYMCKQLGMSKTAAYLSAMVILLPTSEVYRNYVLVNAAYVIYFIYSFTLFGLLLFLTKATNWLNVVMGIVALTIVSIFAGISGLREFLVFFIPVLMAALSWCFCQFHRTEGIEKDRVLATLWGMQGRFLGFSVYATFVAGMGYLYNAKVLGLQYRFLGFSNVRYTNFTLETLGIFFNWCLESLGYSINLGLFEGLFYNAFVFLVMLIVVLSLYSLLKRPKKYKEEIQILDIYFVIALLVLCAFYAFSDMEWGSTRYVLPVMIFVVPIIAIHLSGTPALHKKIATIVLGTLLMINSLQRYEFFFRLDQTRDIRDVVNYVTEQGYEEGYATFWNANVLTELSNGEVDMRCWLDSGDGTLMELVESIDQTYNWLQHTHHTGSTPPGKFFFVLTQIEVEDWPLSGYIADYLLYQNNTYCVYGFESYTQLAPELCGR